MTVKQIKTRLQKLTTKIKSRQAELSTFKIQAKELREKLALAKKTAIARKPTAKKK